MFSAQRARPLSSHRKVGDDLAKICAFRIVKLSSVIMPFHITNKNCGTDVDENGYFMLCCFSKTHFALDCWDDLDEMIDFQRAKSRYL